MSFLLDVADPSIHFRSRQYCNATGSKVAKEPVTSSPLASLSSSSSSSSSEIPSITTTAFNSSSSVKHSLFPPTSVNASNNNAIHSSSSSSADNVMMPMPQLAMPKPTAISLPPMTMPMGMVNGNTPFSAVSRMIRTASASNISPPSNLPSRSTTPFSSRPNTPDVTNVLDPFLTANLNSFNNNNNNNSNNNSTSNAGSSSRIATSLSPWMKPSVCDDDQMNKLVSFQL
ncbi:MAG: hypothetical protein J3Q66DRAFT_338158 [Benniella sp.]|nr:MAG: hypothetical protein J3Q66DRAFT_338158 [Benniella sp.]